MLAILFAMRDALIALALSWVGVTLKPADSEPAAVTIVNEVSSACGADGSYCAPAKPSFNNLVPCDD